MMAADRFFGASASRFPGLNDDLRPRDRNTHSRLQPLVGVGRHDAHRWAFDLRSGRSRDAEPATEQLLLGPFARKRRWRSAGLRECTREGDAPASVSPRGGVRDCCVRSASASLYLGIARVLRRRRVSPCTAGAACFG
jgi:hypothetical protein